jgi:hypothetical protein
MLRDARWTRARAHTHTHTHTHTRTPAIAMKEEGAVVVFQLPILPQHLLVYDALSYWCMRPCATTACGIKLLVYAALSYQCMRP